MLVSPRSLLRPRAFATALVLALASAVTATAPAQAFPGGDRDCSDFQYQQDAQAHFRSHAGDPDRLDSDGDGIACETLPNRPAPAPVPRPAPAPLPKPAPAPNPAPAPVVYPIAIARDVAVACPPTVVPPSGFIDVGGSVNAAVDCVKHWQVASGRTAASYAPAATVSREQMASFIARAIRRAGGNLPAGGDAFVDDDRSVHQGDINALAKASVISGTGGGRFSPRAQVTRAQMAKFLTRSYNYRAAQAGKATLPGGADYFGDDDGSTVQGAINAAARAGFTTGASRGVYNPGGVVRRDQMAVFLTRVLALLVEQQVATVPAAPGGEPKPEPQPAPAAGTAAALLAELPVAPESGAGYDRDALFGDWTDVDSDGCDTRADVLTRESLVPVEFAADSGCLVETGEWLSPFDQVTWTRASDVDIDHLVPLAEAWDSGARETGWDAERRRAFANDQAFEPSLQVVTDNVNSAKSDRDPAQWLPPAAGAWCRYAQDWVAVKYRWRLSVDQAERSALAGLLTGDCGDADVATPEQF